VDSRARNQGRIYERVMPRHGWRTVSPFGSTLLQWK